MRRGAAALQQSATHNQTAAMMEIGSSLLNQTAAQTRKLTDVEAQVSHAGTMTATSAGGGGLGAGREDG